mmetsp:Transcript_23814/g.72889  ORF Transcript_23814/g.72889 Transcript_23814/m.72889 type:complete len:208 (+) Transcript_23814:1604-2227(+)
MVSNGTPSSFPRSSWKTGATTRRRSTSRALRVTLRLASRYHASFLPSYANRRHIRRVWACFASSSLERWTWSCTPSLTLTVRTTRHSSCSSAWQKISQCSRRSLTTDSFADSRTSSPVATRQVTIPTSGRKSSQPMLLPHSRRLASTTRRRCKRSAASFGRRCLPSAVRATHQRCSVHSGAATHPPSRYFATRDSPNMSTMASLYLR